MSLDLNDDYKNAEKLITATKTYNEVKTNINNLKKKGGSSFDKDAKKGVNQLDQLKKDTKSFQRDVNDTFKRLTDLTKLVGAEDGSSSTKYLKGILIEALNGVLPALEQILQEEIQSALGCSQQQTFSPAPVWIPVKSIDLMGMLKIDPTVKSGQVLYEAKDISVGSFPFSLNKELYNRTQNLGQSFQSQYSSLYNGTSGQPLFNIEFTNTGEFGESGDFFKVSLSKKITGVNTVSGFLGDYFSTIEVINLNNVYGNILNLITGMIHMEVNSGKTLILDMKKFEVLLQRILALCKDFNTEIDISGIAKVSELDGVDETFFEMTNVDLRDIDQQITNIKHKVMVFEDCDNVSLPVDYNSILDSVIKINLTSGATQTNQINSLTDFSFKWNIPQINLKIEDDFITKLIQGLVFSVLSPKVLLPIMVMAKSLKQLGAEIFNSFEEFAKKYSKFLFNLTKKYASIFIEKIFNILKKDITKLLTRLLRDINGEKAQKLALMILTLVQLLQTVADLVDFQKCKSVIDGILKLFNKISSGGLPAPGKNTIPLPLLFASKLLDGYSPTRAFAEVIGEMQQLGLPTGPLPDGSPNLGLAHTYAIIKGMSNEQVKNGRADIPIPSLTVPTPLGPLVTIPQQTSGKWI